MKLQIAFDLTDLDKAVSIAKDVADYADIIEIGSLLIYKYGETAIKKFREVLAQETLLVDAKVSDRSKDAINLFASAGADWVTVMAGTNKNIIHAACTAAHNLGKKIMLDLIDASSPGQSALEAESLGVDALLFHKSFDQEDELLFLDRWEMVKGNTKLPLFISTEVTRNTIKDIIDIQPKGIVISKAITLAENPKEEAAFFANIIKA